MVGIEKEYMKRDTTPRKKIRSYLDIMLFALRTDNIHEDTRNLSEDEFNAALFHLSPADHGHYTRLFNDYKKERDKEIYPVPVESGSVENITGADQSTEGR
ncbi:MAG: hypothetical protein V1802_00855 [Candidatus Aenigmatarchaeota archaeon]